MTSLASATWPELEALRTRVNGVAGKTLESASQAFAEVLAGSFPSVVLARVFAVLPFGRLPEFDRAFTLRVVGEDRRLSEKTPVLSLLGTSGISNEWRDRKKSRAHLALPLLDRQFVTGAPMIAKLLGDLEVNLANLDDGRPIATRRLLGGLNATFYVLDAQTARDDANRPIIGAHDFVEQHGIRTVFGMGGAYVDGTLAVAVVFTKELVPRLSVERYPSLIGTFKMATAHHIPAGTIYER